MSDIQTDLNFPFLFLSFAGKGHIIALDTNIMDNLLLTLARLADTGASHGTPDRSLLHRTERFRKKGGGTPVRRTCPHVQSFCRPGHPACLALLEGRTPRPAHQDRRRVVEGSHPDPGPCRCDFSGGVASGCLSGTGTLGDASGARKTYPAQALCRCAGSDLSWLNGVYKVRRLTCLRVVAEMAKSCDQQYTKK